jgi:Ca2+-binding EF-hand superfamily protein
MSNAIVGVASGSTAVQTMTGPSPTMAARPKMSSLFTQIDAAGSGSITRAQFANAFQTMNPPAGFRAMGENAVYAQLDPNDSGSVSRNTFVNAMSALSHSLAQVQPSGGAHAATPAAGPTGTTGAFVNTSA